MASRVAGLILLVALLVTTSGLGLRVHAWLDHDAAHAAVGHAHDHGEGVPADRPHRSTSDDCSTCAALHHVVAIVAVLTLLVLAGRVARSRPIAIRPPGRPARPSPRSTRGPPALACAL